MIKLLADEKELTKALDKTNVQHQNKKKSPKPHKLITTIMLRIENRLEFLKLKRIYK